MKNPVYSKLLGKEVCSWSEEWRHECECASILLMASREARHKHLDAIQLRRGKEAADKLKQDIMRLWEINRANNKNSG